MGLDLDAILRVTAQARIGALPAASVLETTGLTQDAIDSTWRGHLDARAAIETSAYTPVERAQVLGVNLTTYFIIEQALESRAATPQPAAATQSSVAATPVRTVLPLGINRTHESADETGRRLRRLHAELSVQLGGRPTTAELAEALMRETSYTLATAKLKVHTRPKGIEISRSAKNRIPLPAETRPVPEARNTDVAAQPEPVSKAASLRAGFHIDEAVALYRQRGGTAAESQVRTVVMQYKRTDGRGPLALYAAPEVVSAPIAHQILTTLELPFASDIPLEERVQYPLLQQQLPRAPTQSGTRSVERGNTPVVQTEPLLKAVEYMHMRGAQAEDAAYFLRKAGFANADESVVIDIYKRLGGQRRRWDTFRKFEKEYPLRVVHEIVTAGNPVHVAEGIGEDGRYVRSCKEFYEAHLKGPIARYERMGADAAAQFLEKTSV